MARRSVRIALAIAAVGAAVTAPSPATAAADPLLQKLLAPGGAAADLTGTAVAASGDVVVVGAPRADAAGLDAGAAHVYARGSGGWAWEATLLAGDAQAGDQFGGAVAVSGETVVVGASGDDDRGSSSGSAYVFTRTGNGWAQEAKILAPDGAGGDLFGGAVAVSGDAAVVGAINDDDRGSNSGSVYVFARTGTSWPLQEKLRAADGAAGDAFGVSVAVDGDIVAVGATRDDDRGTDSGSVYVFGRTGTSWSPHQKLLAPGGAAGDWFGTSVGLSGDALVAGAAGATGFRGIAHVFRAGAGWAHEATLAAPDGATGDTFGMSVAVAGDFAVVGASGDRDNGAGSGSAWVFDRRGGGVWVAGDKVLPDDGVAGDAFGSTVALTDGAAILGAPGADDLGSNAGAAYVLRANEPPDCSAAWAAPTVLWPPDGTMRPIAIGGITDADGDAVATTVVRVLQNEPLGQGPDAAGIGTDDLWLRADRSGRGGGRSYRVLVAGDDGRGGTCDAELEVVVPRAKGKPTGGDAPAIYDSSGAATTP